MLRTLFAIGLAAIVGLIALKLFFGLFGTLVGLLFWLLGLAIRVALIGLAVYVIIRIVSPDTARRIRERWSGTA